MQAIRALALLDICSQYVYKSLIQYIQAIRTSLNIQAIRTSLNIQAIRASQYIQAIIVLLSIYRQSEPYSVSPIQREIHNIMRIGDLVYLKTDTMGWATSMVLLASSVCILCNRVWSQRVGLIKHRDGRIPSRCLNNQRAETDSVTL